MAITNNGTKNSLPDGQIPTGYTRPTITEFTDYKYVRTVTLSVLKATVENANPVTTMGAIISNGTIGVTKQVTDILAADFDESATGSAFADIVSLTHNYASLAQGSPLYTATAVSYLVTINLYIKTT